MTNKGKRYKQKVNINNVFNDYHTDIWFLISQYIQPEDVGRFALICKKTDIVVSSASFWYNLYNKFIRKKCYHTPPQCLNLEAISGRLDQLRKLRARVIRSLFYIYLPFIKRISNPQNVNIIRQLMCSSVFYKKEESNWILCYRLTNGFKIRKSPRQEILMAEDIQNVSHRKTKATELDFDNDDIDNKVLDKFLLQYNNIFDNSDEGQHLLVIYTKHFIPFPNLYEQNVFLTSIRQPISHDLRNFNLELKFNNYKGDVVFKITYDSIIKFNVISWWDPKYTLFSSL